MTGKRSGARRSTSASRGGAGHRVKLRTPCGASLTLRFRGSLLRRHCVPWNTWLVAGRLRNDVSKSERRALARTLLGEVMRAGGTTERQMDAFLRRALKAGVVQVESDWEGFSAPDTDRLFPWEETLALACRDTIGTATTRPLVVVRWLLRKPSTTPPATGPATIAVTRDAADAPFGTDSEYRVVRGPLARSGADGKVPELHTLASLHALRRCIRPPRQIPPRIVHWMLRSVDCGIVFDAHELAFSRGILPPPGSRRRGPRALATDRVVAEALAANHPAVVGLSSCYTGRRLAPLVIAAGADLAIGFHHEVDDSSLPAFFAEFYAKWLESGDPVVSLRAALTFNRDQPDHEGLGAVTLWSAHDLLAQPAVPQPAFSPERTAKADVPGGLIFDCEPEPALNYSILHCSRGGLFRRFVVTRVGNPPTDPPADPLDVVVRLDTGSGSVPECRFTTPAPVSANSRTDLAALVALPLGSHLLRQRRETLKGSVEVTVGAGGRTLLQRTWAIDLLPCDEWRDDSSGSHFLPSFVLPRDPAVREILSHAQGFLRAIHDCYCAGFLGYPSDRPRTGEMGVDAQVQAIWASLVEHYRLDYITTPPSYRESSQRLRTPEEVLHARRGTCIELALLLASCLEHICIHPVLFLTRNHAFCGSWTTERARIGFFRSLHNHTPDTVTHQQTSSLGGTVATRTGSAPWMLTERFHIDRIEEAVRGGTLVPIDATEIAVRNSYAGAVGEGRKKLRSAIGDRDFDAMLDVRTARERGVTPLPIITDGSVA